MFHSLISALAVLSVAAELPTLPSPEFALKEHKNESDHKEPTTCIEERAQKMKQAAESGLVQLLPSCDIVDNRLYSRVQCHNFTVCWCVDVTSGLPIAGGRPSKHGDPQCDGRVNLAVPDLHEEKEQPVLVDGKGTKLVGHSETVEEEESIKKCPAVKRRRFYRRLRDTFIAEWETHKGKAKDGLKRSKKKRRAIAWKFGQLDVNKNNVIEQREWREYRRMIRTWEGVRTCGRNFFRYCDEDLDKKITRAEWEDCTRHDKRVYIVAPPAPLKRNPFLYLLKPDPS